MATPKQHSPKIIGVIYGGGDLVVDLRFGTS